MFELMFKGKKEAEHLGLNVNGQIARASDKVQLLGFIVNKKIL